MIEFKDFINEVAYVDGSLRDIYIFDVVLEDWNRLLKLLKKSYPLECDEMIPETIQEIIPIREERGLCLSVMLGHNISANCHFYVSLNESSPIEFDLDPRELQSPYAMNKVFEFMQLLGNEFNREVFLTAENCEDIVLLTYSPSTKDLVINDANDDELQDLVYENGVSLKKRTIKVVGKRCEQNGEDESSTFVEFKRLKKNTEQGS